MPTFDFKCPKCDHVFEMTLPFGSKKLPPCPSCKNKKTEKLLSAPGVLFKGSGFYKTDASNVESTKPAESPKETPKTPPSAEKNP